MDTPLERPTFVLVWPDGTVTLDSPDSNKESGLMTYLTSLQYGHNDEPLSAVYMAKTGPADLEKAHHLGGWLQQVAIVHTNTENVGNDWLEVTYGVFELNPGGEVLLQGPVTSITIRVDGRA